MASTKSEEFMLADSTSLSLPLSVLLLSSEPARSIADAELTIVVSPVVAAILTHKIACDLDECVFSYHTKSALSQ